MKKYAYTKAITFEGKRYFVRADSEAELAAKLALKLRDLEEGRKAVSRHMLVRDWSGQWLEVYKERTVSDKTLGSIRTTLSRINADIGALRLSAVRSLHCQAVLNSMAGMSWSAATKVRQVMAEMFDRAVENSLMLENPAKRVQLPKTHKGTHRALTGQERRVLLSVCEGGRYGLWVLLMYHCGLRPGETARVMGRHIDLKRRILHVDGTKTTAAVRDVPIPEKLAQRLEMEPVGAFEPLLANGHGVALTKSNMHGMWEQAKKDMHVALGGRTDYGGLRRIIPPLLVASDLVPYCLRHDYATRLQAAGVPINVAKELLGHSSIEMTARIYTHSSEESFENARRLMDAME
jgi:integrase